MNIWTIEALRQIAPNAKTWIIEALCAHIEMAFKVANIDNPLEQAYFIANIAHESAGFRTTVEYGRDAYFDKYDLRRDIGNYLKGHGAKFKGRGLIQLTGLANYKKHGFEKRPHDVAKFPAALDVSIKFWLDNHIGKHALKDDIRKVTRIINGGYNGLADRKKYLKRAKRIIRSGNDNWLNTNLKKLGYVDVKSFQRENGLVVDGDAGTLTRAKIQEFLKANEKQKSKTNLKSGVGLVGVTSAVNEAAYNIEPLQEFLPMLKYVFIGLTVLGAGLVIWSMVKSQVAPEEARG